MMATRRSEALFERVAREDRLPPPPGLVLTPEAHMTWCRKVWAAFPAWGYDETYVEEAARPHLPRVLAQIGLGKLVARVGSDTDVLLDLQGVLGLAERHVFERGDHIWPDWRAVFRELPALLNAAAGKYHPSPIMRFRLAPEDRTPLLFNDISHEWWCPRLNRQGDGLIQLGAWRWDISETKAAWRIAKLCGLERPVP